MDTGSITAFFNPASIVVIGAYAKVSSLGFMVMWNLMRAGFSGPIMPKYKSVCGVLTYRTVDELPMRADLPVGLVALTFSGRKSWASRQSAAKIQRSLHWR